MRILLIIMLLLGVSAAQTLPERVDYEGLMPAVEVVAERYDNNFPAYMGAMPEVTVTATRYEHEDIAWSGLMPEVLVVATRPSLEALVHSSLKVKQSRLDIIPSTLVR